MQLTALFSKTKSPKDVMLGVTVFSVVACVIKFLMEGVVITVGHHVLNMGHADPLAYGAILTPILGAHGYIKGVNLNRDYRRNRLNGTGEVDNVDQN